MALLDDLIGLDPTQLGAPASRSVFAPVAQSGNWLGANYRRASQDVPSSEQSALLDPGPAFARAAPPAAAGPPGLASPASRLNDGLASNPHLLMGLGAGLLSGRSLGEAMSQALRGASDGAQIDSKAAARNQTAVFLKSR